MEIVLIVLCSISIAFCTFLIARSKSHDGKMLITVNEEGNKVFTLELDGDPADLEHKRAVSFKVVPSGKEE